MQQNPEAGTASIGSEIGVEEPVIWGYANLPSEQELMCH
jgi:hypothetical protein